jgi:hypothetical protein
MDYKKLEYLLKKNYKFTYRAYKTITRKEIQGFYNNIGLKITKTLDEKESTLHIHQTYGTEDTSYIEHPIVRTSNRKIYKLVKLIMERR